MQTHMKEVFETPTDKALANRATKDALKILKALSKTFPDSELHTPKSMQLRTDRKGLERFLETWDTFKEKHNYRRASRPLPWGRVTYYKEWTKDFPEIDITINQRTKNHEMFIVLTMIY